MRQLGDLRQSPATATFLLPFRKLCTSLELPGAALTRKAFVNTL